MARNAGTHVKTEGKIVKVTIKIDPGVCNFNTVVTAETEDSQDVTFVFKTECESMKEFAKQIAGISPVDAVATLGREENPILAKARSLLQAKGCCEACIVPAGAVKAMQVAANLALAKDVSMQIVKE